MRILNLLSMAGRSLLDMREMQISTLFVLTLTLRYYERYLRDIASQNNFISWDMRGYCMNWMYKDEKFSVSSLKDVTRRSKALGMSLALIES